MFHNPQPQHSHHRGVTAIDGPLCTRSGALTMHSNLPSLHEDLWDMQMELQIYFPTANTFQKVSN